MESVVVEGSCLPIAVVPREMICHAAANAVQVLERKLVEMEWTSPAAPHPQAARTMTNAAKVNMGPVVAHAAAAVVSIAASRVGGMEAAAASPQMSPKPLPIAIEAVASVAVTAPVAPATALAAIAVSTVMEAMVSAAS